jgi:hypothetical protein
VLGPLLFLLYVNDIADNLLSLTRLFADDTSLSYSSQSPFFILLATFAISFILLVRKGVDLNEHERLSILHLDTNQSKGTAHLLQFYISQSQ